MKLYADQKSVAAYKALIAAKYAGVNVQVAAADKSALEKTPFGKAPVLETSEGVISEANAIARYIARQGKGLYGNTAFETAAIDQWIELAANEIELPGNVWTYPILDIIPNNGEATQKAKGDVRKALDVLNKHLTTRTFLVGNRISLADIVVALSLFHLYQLVLDNGFRKQFVNTNRWFLTIVNQPEVKSVVGDVKLCDKMQVAKEVAAAPKKETPKKETPAPKKEAPKPKPEASLEDAAEEEEKADKKKPNPLDSLPPTAFDLDAWKRTYSNTDTRGEAIPYFWNNLDKEGWSLWVGDYKYNDECQKVFMTANLLGGFIQRLDKLRKYGFGSLCIFGEEPNLQVGACFLVRGQVVPPELSECDDYEHYVWRKIDPANQADVDLVNDYWAWDGSFGGKKFIQGKSYK